MSHQHESITKRAMLQHIIKQLEQLQRSSDTTAGLVEASNLKLNAIANILTAPGDPAAIQGAIDSMKAATDTLKASDDALVKSISDSGSQAAPSGQPTVA